MIYLSMMIKAAAVYASRRARALNRPEELLPHSTPAHRRRCLRSLEDDGAARAGSVGAPTSSRSSMAGARARQPEARHHHLIDRFDRSPALLDLRLGGRHCAEQLGPTKRGAFGSSGSGRGDNASSGLLRAQDNRLAS
jgi:hypothetical protein